MRTLVLYASKTGFVEKYARWIVAELYGSEPVDLAEIHDFDCSALSRYDTVIFGGGLYAGGINGLSILKKNLDKLSGARIAVFATGATPTRAETTGELLARNFTPEERERIAFFYLRGGFDYSRLKPVDKFLMTLMKWKILLKPKDARLGDERGMLASYSAPADFTKKSNLKGLLAWVRSGI